MPHPRMLKRSAILLLLLSLPITGCAERPPHDPEAHYGPPPEAIVTCKDKQEGDSVSFIGRQGESIKATCKTMVG